MSFDLTTNIMYPGAVTHVLQYLFHNKVVELVEQVLTDDYVTARFAPNAAVSRIESEEYHFGLFVNLTFTNGSSLNFTAVEAIEASADGDGYTTVDVIANGALYTLTLSEAE